jgi:hypothetical protein
MICFRLLFHQTNEVTILLHIILIGIVAIVGGSIYFVLPLAVQLILFAINAIVPDPIPYLDEIIMVGGILSKLKKLDDIEDFISEHKVLFCIIAVGIVILLVQFLRWIF